MPTAYAVLLLARALHGLSVMVEAEARIARLRRLQARVAARWADGCGAVDGGVGHGS